MYYAVYDMDDNCVALCRNYEELGKFFGRKPEYIQISLSRFNRGKRNSIFNNRDRKFYKIYKYKDKK